MGGKPCTYTVNVRRAVPPRLAFVPRSLIIDEGGTGTYTVELDTRILTGAVTIAIASDNPDVTVSPTEVTLKPLDMAPRTITVTAASDDDRDDENVVITHTANGAHYYDVIATVGVTVNDTTPDPALSVSAATLALVEGGQGSYTVALAVGAGRGCGRVHCQRQPRCDGGAGGAGVHAGQLGHGAVGKVSAASDNDAAADTATLTHTASGGGYDAAPAARVMVSVTDDDRAGLVIAPDELAITENGSGVFRVTLGTQPTAQCDRSHCQRQRGCERASGGAGLYAGNWDTGQPVSVSARVDAGQRGRAGHRAADGAGRRVRRAAGECAGVGGRPAGSGDYHDAAGGAGGRGRVRAGGQRGAGHGGGGGRGYAGDGYRGRVRHRDGGGGCGDAGAGRRAGDLSAGVGCLADGCRWSAVDAAALRAGGAGRSWPGRGIWATGCARAA